MKLYNHDKLGAALALHNTRPEPLGAKGTHKWQTESEKFFDTYGEDYTKTLADAAEEQYALIAALNNNSVIDALESMRHMGDTVLALYKKGQVVPKYLAVAAQVTNKRCTALCRTLQMYRKIAERKNK